MGHYASEMMCQKCGKLRCKCPPPKDAEAHLWILHDFKAVQVGEFDKESPTAWVARLYKKKYASRADAEAAIPEEAAKAIAAAEAAIKEAKARIKELKKLL